MERAYNPKTNEYVFLVDNEWVKPESEATNPKTGERAFLVNNQWEIVPGQKAPVAPQAPAAAPVKQEISPLAPLRAGSALIGFLDTLGKLPTSRAAQPTATEPQEAEEPDRKSTRLNSSH